MAKTFQNTSRAIINIDGRVIAPGASLTVEDARAAELEKSISFSVMLVDGRLIKTAAVKKSAKDEGGEQGEAGGKTPAQ